MAHDIAARIQALEAQMQVLQDREAVRALRYRYHQCINEGKLAEIPELFTEDGDLDFGYLGKARGREELTVLFGGVSQLLSFVKQFVHNKGWNTTMTGRRRVPPSSMPLSLRRTPGPGSATG